MCLDELFALESRPEINMGYKVMIGLDGDTYVPAQRKEPKFKLGVEVEDAKDSVIDTGCVETEDPDSAENPLTYKTGFHIFLNLDDAIDYLTSSDDYIFEVHFSDVVAYGLQEDTTAHSVVARRMTLVREVTPEEVEKRYAIMTAKQELYPLPQVDTPIECDHCKKVINLSEARVDLTGNHFCDGKCEYEYWHVLGRCE